MTDRTYVVAWTGGHEGTSYKGHETYREALRTALSWYDGTKPGDEIEILIVDHADHSISRYKSFYHDSEGNKVVIK